jgi:hypothetical protein
MVAALAALLTASLLVVIFALCVSHRKSAGTAAGTRRETPGSSSHAVDTEAQSVTTAPGVATRSCATGTILAMHRHQTASYFLLVKDSTSPHTDSLRQVQNLTKA